MKWFTPMALVCSVALVSCNEPDVDAPSGPVLHEGAPFWAPIVLEEGVDLGHRPERTPSPGAGPVVLREVALASGLSGVHGGGNGHGVGVSFADVNGDGLPDVFIANGCRRPGGHCYPSRLLTNVGDGMFADATESSGIGSILVDAGGAAANLYSIAAADYDADGDLDLYLGAQPTDILLQNQGDGTFIDATASARAGGPPSDPELTNDGRSKIVAFGDFDRDGLLDVVSASSTLDAPGVYLLRNRGDGTFEDVTEEQGVFIHERGNPCAVLWSDYDTDGDLDLWIWNDRGGHVLLRNDRGRFTDVMLHATGTSIGHAMGIDSGDPDRDLDPDYYLSDTATNPLFINSGDGTFVNETRAAGTEGPDWQYGWGLGFEDLNLDGWQDIFVSQEDERHHLVFTNSGELPLRFEYSTVRHGRIPANPAQAHNVPVAFADYDLDGRVDVLLAGTSGDRILLYRNETEVMGQSYLHVRVRARPGSQEIGGIGARVAISTPDGIQFKEIHGGSSRASQNQTTARFGLGEWSGADWVAVQWPDGTQAVATGVPGNQVVELPVETD